MGQPGWREEIRTGGGLAGTGVLKIWADSEEGSQGVGRTEEVLCRMREG